MRTKSPYLNLCSALNHGGRSVFCGGPDLKVVAARVLGRHRDELQFAGKLVVLGQLHFGLNQTDQHWLIASQSFKKNTYWTFIYQTDEYRMQTYQASILFLTVSLALARAISSFHMCCSACSRLLLRLLMVCCSSLFSQLILSMSAGVNFWVDKMCWSRDSSCFRVSTCSPTQDKKR